MIVVQSKTLYFFGDSWTEQNSELEILFPKENFLSYPDMVGQLLNIRVKNLAEGGTSQMDMLDKLAKSDIQDGDHALFCLTAPSRRFYVDEHNCSQNSFCDHDKNKVNDFYDSFLSATVVLAIEQICNSKNITPWFMCAFDTSYNQQTAHQLWKFVDFGKWLISPATTIVRELFDPIWFKKYKVQKNTDFADWLNEDNQQVKKLIRPCQGHPNIEGRKLIAEFVYKKLKDKLQG